MRQVHCLDLRNHGDSPHLQVHTQSAMAGDVIKYVTNQITGSNTGTKCVLLGHSMGGRVAFDAVFTHPQLFLAAIIEDSSPFATKIKTLVSSDDINSPFAAIQILKDVDLESMQNGSLSSVKRQISDLLSEKVPSSAVQSFLLTNLIQDAADKRIKWRCNIPAIAKYLESYRSLTNSHTFEMYKEMLSQPIEVPLLVVRGSNSNYVSDEDVSLMRELFSDLTLSTLETGHWVHSEKPKEFFNGIADFLATKT